MKKILALVMTAMLILSLSAVVYAEDAPLLATAEEPVMTIASDDDALTIATAAADNTYYAAKGEAVVDGVKDDIYNKCTPFNINQIGVTDGTDTATGTAYVAWSDTTIYVFFEVKDATHSGTIADPAQQPDYDSAVVLIDLNCDAIIDNDWYDNDEIDSLGTYVLMRDLDKESGIKGHGWHPYDNDSNCEWAIVEVEGGYNAEMSFPLADCYQRDGREEHGVAVEGDMIGLSFCIMDDKDGEAGIEAFSYSGEGMYDAEQADGSYWDGDGELKTFMPFDDISPAEHKVVLTADGDTSIVEDEPAEEEPAEEEPAEEEPVATADALLAVSALALISAGAVIAIKRKH